MKIFLSVLFIAIIGLSIYFIPRVIKINSIECESQYGPCASALTSRIDEVNTDKLSETKQQLNDIFTDNIFIREFSYQYGYPDKLKVFVVEEKSVFALTFSSGKTVLVSRNGYVLALSDSTNLPTVATPREPPNIGEKISDDNLFALDLIYDAYPLYDIEKSNISVGGLHVFLKEGYEIIFPLNGDKDLLLGTLNLILSRLQMDTEELRIEDVIGVEIIDLRFKNPVLRLSN